jgi:hypothetical protein
MLTQVTESPPEFRERFIPISQQERGMASVLVTYLLY